MSFSIDIQAIELSTGKPIICEIKFAKYLGKINTYGCHLSKLTHCNTTEERLMRCLNQYESTELQSQLDLAGNNETLRTESIQKMASKTISSY